MGWNEAKILHGGIYVDYQCSGITNLQGEGVFIPLDPNGGPAMRELDTFLKKYCYLPEGESIPEYYLKESFFERVKRTGKIPVYTPEGVIEVEREALRGKD